MQHSTSSYQMIILNIRLLYIKMYSFPLQEGIRLTLRALGCHTSCLRKLLKIKWQDRISETEVLKKAVMQSVHTLLKLAQLRWTRHVTRMPDEPLPKKILYGELQVGKVPMVVRRSDTRTPSKPPLETSTYQQSHGNRLHRIVQSGEAS